jgi:transketolase
VFQNGPRTFDLSKKMANAIRVLAMDAVERAKSGHPGMPMGMADVATVLFADFLKFNPSDPTWFDRDRFVLSAGHGSMLLYALGYLTGYPDMTLDQLKHFRHLHSLTPGHPEYHPEVGIETTTGPLGQGLGNAVGMALAESILRARFGASLVDHFTYCVVGDGCLMEGISQEAISFAGHLGLGRLIVLFDDNKISIDGPTSLSTSEDTLKRFEACGWHVQSIDGHNQQEIFEALTLAKAIEEKPSLIACRTTIGFGSPNKGGTADVHGSPLGPEEVLEVRKTLGWTEPAFEIPSYLLKTWREAPLRNDTVYQQWQKNFEQSPASFKESIVDILPPTWKAPLFELIERFVTEAPLKATRQSSGMTLDILTQAVPNLIGGSADLTGSNNTKASLAQVVTRTQPNGNYIHYGVREHAMGAIMNGIAHHKGLIPYGGTFLVFTDYCRPAIRLSALSEERVIYVMTHDSIGLGEDGPTHQPIEHLASLRAIPNLNVFRPADAVEVVESWLLALESLKTPSILALSRQNVPTLRHTYVYGENLTAYGAYIIRNEPENKKPDVCLIATGSEVSLAIEVQKILETQKIFSRVVSMPCRRLFELQSPDYQQATLGTCAQRFVIEAASPFGWEKYATSSNHIFGITTFGASAPYIDLYVHFGLTPQPIADRILAILHQKDILTWPKEHA